MNSSCNAVVRGQKQDMHIAINNSCISQPLADQALLALWDHLFALYEGRSAEVLHHHSGMAPRHGVALFDPACAQGGFRWPHVSTIRFHSAPSLTIFVFTVEFMHAEDRPLLFTVAQHGDTFRVQDALVSMA